MFSAPNLHATGSAGAATELYGYLYPVHNARVNIAAHDGHVEGVTREKLGKWFIPIKGGGNTKVVSAKVTRFRLLNSNTTIGVP